MKIRLATTKDLDGMMNIEELCFGEERFDRGTVRAYMSRRDAFAMVAVEGKVTAGAAMGMVSTRLGCGRIGSVAVLGRYRGKGLGKRLLEACEKEFLKRGVTRFLLEVSVDNIEAVRLYESCGYQVTGVMEGYYSNKRDAYLMEKDVTLEGRRVRVRPS